MNSIQDRDMERLYMLVQTIGYRRAIAEVAGQMYDSETDSFVHNIAYRYALAERYASEMAEFEAAGGY